MDSRRLLLSFFVLFAFFQNAFAAFVVDQNGQVWEVKYGPRWAIVAPLIVLGVLLLGGVAFLIYWLFNRRSEERDVYYPQQQQQEPPKPAGGAAV